MSDQDRISPCNVNSRSSDENKEKCHLEDYKLIKTKFFKLTINTRTVLGVRGLTSFSQGRGPYFKV